MLATSSAIPLPAPIARYIDRFVARWRWQRLARAAARALLFTIVWTLAWCIIDRLITLDAAARATAGAINLAAIVIILARPALAMLRHADPNIAAAEIERREPTWSQRLRTITSRLADGGSETGFSRELLDTLSQQVADEVRDKNPAALLSWRRVVRPALACGVWLLIAGAMSFSSWLELPTLVRRYVLPLSVTPAVKTTRIIATPGDAEITQGEPLRVQASVIRLSAASRAPMLHVRARADSANPQGWHVEPMTATQDGKFEAQIARVDRDLDYFLTAGDARTETWHVAMLPRPAVTRFRMHYTYPPHTGLAPRDVVNDTGVIEAAIGTDVMLAVETTEPLSYAILTIGSESIRMPAAAQTSFVVNGDRRYTLRMVSERGVSGVFRGGIIRGTADRAPVAQFRDVGGGGGGGGAKREVAADDVVPIAYQAMDDYGLARLDLEIRVIRTSGAEANAVDAVPLTRGPARAAGRRVRRSPPLRTRDGRRNRVPSRSRRPCRPIRPQSSRPSHRDCNDTIAVARAFATSALRTRCRLDPAGSFRRAAARADRLRAGNSRLLRCPSPRRARDTAIAVFSVVIARRNRQHHHIRRRFTGSTTPFRTPLLRENGGSGR
jgi:hypothetical protein